ncbi:MAG: sugar nucleotide-binding protein [Pseudomonadota bacterium]
MKPKILITGASSYLAHRLVPIAAGLAHVYGVSRRRDAVVPPASAVEFDLASTVDIAAMVKKINPDAIIHAAAVNPGDGDELMDAVNHRASAALAECALEQNIRYVMVSSESVHSGLAAPYADNAGPDPINNYGHTKAAGEHAVRVINPNAVIVRTSLIYGVEKMDRGTRGFRDRATRGETLVLFRDVYRQPVWADSLSDVLCDLAVEQRHISGVMNMVGSQRMSRADFGLKMLEFWGIDPGADVELGSGAGLGGVQMDLTCTCELADELGYQRPGVDDVLSRHQHAR